jgi:uncharacterized protein
MKALDVMTAALLIVGGLNWGLVALANLDLVALVTGAGQFGSKNVLGAVIYAVVGLSAVYQVWTWRSSQRHAAA